MLTDPLNIAYLVLFTSIVVIRKIYTSRQGKPCISKPSRLEILILFFLGIAMLGPLVYLFTDLVQFANYKSPFWIRSLGLLFFISACWMLWRSHVDLGKSWTFTMHTRNAHQLVKTGVYRHIRHPMYAAHFLWALAQVIMIPNWIIGPSLIIFILLLYWYRIEKEEHLLLEKFGDEYREYQKATGRLFPKIINSFSG